jgi:hypothetical protein
VGELQLMGGWELGSCKGLGLATLLPGLAVLTISLACGRFLSSPCDQPFFCYRTQKVVAIPTYEEAMYCPLAEGSSAPPACPPEEDLWCGAPGQALLGTPSPSPPPSYRSIVLVPDAVSGMTPPAPGAVCSCSDLAQTAGGIVGS